MGRDLHLLGDSLLLLKSQVTERRRLYLKMALGHRQCGILCRVYEQGDTALASIDQGDAVMGAFVETPLAVSILNGLMQFDTALPTRIRKEPQNANQYS